jgi:hypothetical protein
MKTTSLVVCLLSFSNCYLFPTSDENAIQEATRGESPPHRIEGSEEANELNSSLTGKPPQSLVRNEIGTNIPRLGAPFAQITYLSDTQTCIPKHFDIIGNGFELDQHPALDRPNV